MGLVSGKLSCPSCSKVATDHRIWFCTLAGARVYSVDPDASWNFARNLPVGQYKIEILHKTANTSVWATSPYPLVVPPSSLLASISSPCTLTDGEAQGEPAGVLLKWKHYENSDFLERTPAKVRAIFRKAALNITGFRYALQVFDADAPLPDGDIEDADLLKDVVLGAKGQFVYGAAACLPASSCDPFPEVN
jgi:hypothetical protein